MFSSVRTLFESKPKPYEASTSDEIIYKLSTTIGQEKALLLSELAKSHDVIEKLVAHIKAHGFELARAQLKLSGIGLKAALTKYKFNVIVSSLDKPEEAGNKFETYFNFDHDKQNLDDFKLLEKEVYHLFGEELIHNQKGLLNEILKVLQDIDHIKNTWAQVELVMKARVAYLNKPYVVILADTISTFFSRHPAAAVAVGSAATVSLAYKAMN